jgi:UDP-N-acetylglucosamine acyltransferase
MSSAVHETAVIEAGAELGPSVQVGPFAVIGARVRLGAGCLIEAHAVISGDTWLGAENRVGAHAVLGGPPQVRGLEGAGALRVGRGNVIREHCTVHAGQPGSETRLGDANLLMAGSHVAHECVLGSHIELANGVQLAGHVQVGDHAGLGGLAAVHQFVRVGPHAFVGAGSMVSQDVPPFSLVAGDRARVYGLNLVGLRRHGFTAGQRRQLARALRQLLRAPTLEEGLALVRQEPAGPELALLVEFASRSRRGLCRLVSRRVEDA